ncbi:beta-galactosidase [Streptomyces sp. CA-106131]|uniref:beta-galactosidase n=1 Tax=Streptomyces sp. CA-106131 TaxID=3240045 RepID=UPI003D92BB89
MNLRRRRHRKSLYFVSLTVAVLLAAGILIAKSVWYGQGGRYYFGTLATDPSKARLEHNSGIYVAHLNLRWDQYEPADGFYDRHYIDSAVNALRTFRNAGSLVEVGLGLNHPPSWIFQEHPDAAYVNQYGARYTATANIVFSEAARREAQAYILRVHRDIGLEKFWAIRVGVDQSGEFIYPPANADGVHMNSYWAFDVNAQGSASNPGRPATVPANPFPGWRPGQREYQGMAFTVSQVSRWYDWYLAALSDAVDWQIKYYRSLGYKGYLKVLIPGAGYYPSTYASAIDSHLDGTVSPNLLGAGAGFFKTIPLLKEHTNVEIVSTALVDGSGNPRNNGCAPTDSKVDILAASNKEIYNWSSVRWIANISTRNGFTLLNGESAGPHVAPYYRGAMNDAANQMVTCGLRGLMWAFDGNLYDETPGSSLHDYAAVIDRYNH